MKFRKTIRGWATITLLLAFGYFNSAAQVVAPSGLVGWWSGDGGANDISGNGANGNLQNGTGFSVGRVGQAFNLDGSDDYIDLGPGFSLDDLTLETWVFIDQTTNINNQRVISKDNAGLAATRKVFNLLSSCGSGGAGGRPCAGVLIGGSSEGVIAPAVLTTGWHHLAFIRDASAGRLELYVDGSLVASTIPALVGAIDSNVNTVIGRVSPTLASEPFLGRIDETSIYNRALTGAEIASIFNAGAAGKLKACLSPPANMVAWFPGDGNGNDIAAGNNGTLINGVGIVPGRVGGAFSFDGINDSVNATQTASLSPSFTFDAWINPTSLANNPVVFERAFSLTDRVGLQILTNGAIGGFLDSAGGFNVAAPAGAIVPGRFTHVALVFDDAAANEAQIYIDGVLVASASDGTPLGTPATLVIGNSTVSPAADFFTGLIDEFEVFNRALSASEIQAIFNAGSSGKCKPVAPALSSPTVARIGDATLGFPAINQIGTHRVVPLSLSPLPFGFHTGLAYDIATTAAFTGSPSVCFNLPAFTTAAAFTELRVLHLESGVWQNRTTTSDFATRTLCSQITSLSPFVIATLAPSAANASVGGRAVTADGNGIAKVRVTVFGGNLPQPITIQTSPFGYYRFDGLATGQMYIVEVASKRFTFADPTRMIDLSGDVADIDFTADSP